MLADIYGGEENDALVHAAGTIAAPLLSASMQALIRLVAASRLRSPVPRSHM